MSNPPSRSEIESALAGRTRKAKAQPREKARADFEFGEQPRRRQVIGGNLAGVNQGKKFGLFSRYSDLNLVNWVAGALVVLILAAFFWPQKNDAITEVTRQLDENRVVEVEDQTIEQAVNGTSNFARETDIERAEDYREQDKVDAKIEALLDVASEHIRQRQFTRPEDSNAVLVYNRVLELSPNNVEATQGLDKIRQHFLYNGVNALNADKPALASSNLQRLAIVDETSSEYDELKFSIDEYRVDQKVVELLKKASVAVEQDNLILPARQSALAYYQQALALREDNQAAKDGIKGIADNYIDQANTSVLTGEFEAASAQLATVSLIDPDHKSIPLIEAMIARAKPLAEQAKLNQQAAELQAQREAALQQTTSEELSSSPANTSDGEVSFRQFTADNQDSDRPLSTNPNTPASETVNLARTPERQAAEQATFDQQYLEEGLEAYYSGDYEKASALLQPLADKGVARSQMRLAYMHFLGRGFPRDRNKADEIVRSALPAIRKFANEGRGWAQSDLGSLYEDGLVLPRDYGEAVYWYRTAAEKGYPGAQTNLGIMYARGRGVTSSRRTAIEWFQRAAKQGDNIARRNLEAMGVN